MTRPELLAPAGGREALIAAVQSGADAVYLGAGRFNARQSADNFGENALSEAVRYAHARNVRVHVTLNTLVHEDERRQLVQTIEEIADAHPDAALVQDFGVARLVREIVPELPLHASTQMAAHNRAAVEFLAREGFARVVLAREMSLDEIRECTGLGIETEVFVHGALCVACSGQCLFSSMVGGRSGNRGCCAQPCRLAYRMDGREGYLLSTRDLCAIDQLDALRKAGVSSFKIEGRLKRPEYVCEVVRAYRNAIDCAETIDETVIANLKQMFNRGGFTKGYLPGANDTQLIYAARPNHLGVSVGKCAEKGKIRLTENIDSADVLALRAPGKRANLNCDCMEALEADRPVKLSGRAGEIASCPNARKNDALIRLVSEVQMRKNRAFCAEEHRARRVNAEILMRVGENLELTMKEMDSDRKTTVFGETVERAQNRNVDPARVRDQIAKAGGTEYCVERVEVNADSDAFCPVSALNAIRRAALERLCEVGSPKPYAVCKPKEIQPIEGSPRTETEILVESANPAALAQAYSQNIPAIFAPEDVRIDALNAALTALPDKFFLAPPMVLGEKSLETLNAWAHVHAERVAGVYISNIGQFAFAWPGEMRADFSLNAANRDAIRQLREWGANRIAVSVELTAGQIALLDGEREIIVHGTLPLMQLRHCPYRTTHECLGRHADCRRCDNANDPLTGRAITDRMGVKFPLRRVATEEGCVVRVMNSVPLMLLKRIQKLPKAEAWRIIAEDAQEAADLIRLYAKALHHTDFKSDPAWKKYESLPATTGHFFRGT